MLSGGYNMKKLLKEWREYISEEVEGANSVKSQEQANEVGSETQIAEHALLETNNLSEQEMGSLSEQFEFATNQGFSDPERFAKAFFLSYNFSSKIGFLTHYKVEDFMKMKLFLIRRKGQEVEPAGFAIKDGNDIVSVHNNSKNLKKMGIGDLMIREAIKQGGTKLDHFDGFLSGYYRKHGFKVVKVDNWAEKYIPDMWDFPKTKIDNPEQSVYAKAVSKYGKGYRRILNVDLPKEIKVQIENGIITNINPMDKTRQYDSGRPDVIYRQL